MRIEYDFDFTADGHILGTHFIETDPAHPLGVLDPNAAGPKVSIISLIEGMHKGTKQIAGTGWDEITKHPKYPGKTRLEVVKAEIVRLNDAPTRALLGI